jgi:uncharacterized protein YbjT (DUF2867 family)
MNYFDVYVYCIFAIKVGFILMAITHIYLKVKGETEDAIKNLSFNSFSTFRPSMLLGDRTEFRFGESMGKIVMQLFSFLFIGKLKRYKAIHVNQVASAMIKQSKLNKPGNTVIENEEIMY